jgi:calcineurin-like phosphoesterase family protein
MRKRKTWFTSDTHFGHRNVIKYCNRPYSKPILDSQNRPVLDDKGQPKVFLDVARMDEDMIRYWNERVDPDDDVYHAGDFAMAHGAEEKYLERLNGRKHFVWGNHDNVEIRLSSLWQSSEPYMEIRLDGKMICIFHYASMVWNKSHHGSIMLYGHSHGSLKEAECDQRTDIGADCWGLKPASWEDVKRRLATLPPYRPVDHHGRD